MIGQAGSPYLRMLVASSRHTRRTGSNSAFLSTSLLKPDSTTVNPWPRRSSASAVNASKTDTLGVGSCVCGESSPRMNRIRSRTSCMERRASVAISCAACATFSSPDIASASLRSTTDVSDAATEPWRANTARSRSSSMRCCNRSDSACRRCAERRSAHPGGPRQQHLDSKKEGSDWIIKCPDAVSEFGLRQVPQDEPQ